MTATVNPSREETETPKRSPDSPPARHASLIAAAAKLRSGPRRSFPIETVLLVAGGLLLPIGIVVIILGWYGSAHTFHVYEQNNYLISGGLLGLGLVFIGGFLYFGYWMTRQIRTSTTANQQMLQVLGRIEAQLGAGANGKHPVAALGVSAATIAPQRARTSRARAGLTAQKGGSAESPRAGSDAEPPGREAPDPTPLVATERGNLIHRPDCPVVANKDNLRAVGPDEPGFRPCQICSPFDRR